MLLRMRFLLLRASMWSAYAYVAASFAALANGSVGELAPPHKRT
jgi:hypothetical protein